MACTAPNSGETVEVLAAADIDTQNRIQQGKIAYAYQQASTRERMKLHCEKKWQGVLSRLLHMEDGEASIMVEHSSDWISVVSKTYINIQQNCRSLMYKFMQMELIYKCENMYIYVHSQLGPDGTDQRNDVQMISVLKSGPVRFFPILGPNRNRNRLDRKSVV